MTLGIRRTATALAAAAAVVVPVAFASPALAATSSGCTVTPLTPTYVSTAPNGVKQINYRISATCNAGRTLYVEQRRYEEDGFLNPDDLTGSLSTSRYFSTTSSYTFNVIRSLPDTESGAEEVYHKVRFRVSSNGVVSAWTGWQKSGVRSFYN